MHLIARRPLPGLLVVAALLAVAAPASARVGPQSFAPLVKQVMPTVVNIAVTETVAGRDPLAGLPPELRRQFHERFRAHNERVQGAGSGFIIDPSGVIVTNNHVVGNADRIVVGLSDGTQLPAKLIGADELTDVAVIKVDAPGPLPAARWGDSRAVEVGDWVIAAGNPFALGGSVTAGIISARGRDIGAGPFDDFIQIDAPINPGNSGGPLFNEDGEVVGMNSAIYSPTGGSVGIGFAIPSELVRQIVQELRAHGHIDRGWLGVSVEDIPPGAHQPTGVAVEAVDRTGPAARSGVRPGDVVLTLNGQPLDSARSLTRAVALTAPGNTVRLAIRRQGRELTLPVIVGKRPKIEEN
jgi:serine protease Do